MTNEFKHGYSDNDSKLIVRTDDRGILILKADAQGIEPEDFPGYADIETGEFVYHESLPQNCMEKALEYAGSELGDDDQTLEPQEDSTRWESQIQEVLGEPDFGEFWAKKLDESGEQVSFEEF